LKLIIAFYNCGSKILAGYLRGKECSVVKYAPLHKITGPFKKHNEPQD
jgi:hypothetical protein